MCDICSDGESDRDCIFDKSLSTASGPGKQREMGLQVKKKSSEISRQMYYWNSMTTKSFWTLKGTVHQITCMTSFHVWKTKEHIQKSKYLKHSSKSLLIFQNIFIALYNKTSNQLSSANTLCF